jgi:outer membrane protein
MRKKCMISMMLFTVCVSAQNILDQYIQDALANNLALQQKEFSFEISIAALKQARGMFMPSLSIEARYTRAGGGRKISIPVGDLMNPVYATLNQLLSQSGQIPLFPENIPNVTEPFLREKEHESKIRLIQPIFQPAILSQYHIKSSLKKIDQAARDIYRRELVLEVKTAYFNFLETLQIQSLLRETEALLIENHRVSQSLFDHDKVTRAVVLRAEAELHAFHQQQAEADKNHHLAKAYFNFLLNRPLDTEIAVADFSFDNALPALFKGAEDRALVQREEIKQLTETVHIMESQVSIARSKFLPGISAVVDYGYQGETYRFDRDDEFWMANLVASWNLFNGFQDKYKIDQTRMQKNAARLKLEEVKQQIRLQVMETAFNLNTSVRHIETAQAQLKAARKSYELVEVQYREGMIPHIEYIDARNRLTQAEVNAIVARYEFQIRIAECEKAAADYPIRTTG